jgi:FAD/FMN-containing dehydrogenase
MRCMGTLARSSYGLFGIVYEVTFRIRPLVPMKVYHQRFSLDEFARQLPQLKARGQSIMLYINPFLDRIMVEFREYQENLPPKALSHWQWRLRNWIWSKRAPHFGYLVTKYVPGKALREFLTNTYNRLVIVVAVLAIKGDKTSATSQMIRYPQPSDNSRYTFSIWAFPEERYLDCLRSYFDFSKRYHKETGYRVNLLSVGYRIKADQSSLFSYSFDGDVMTFDPVSTSNPGWTEFLSAYNELCSQLGGVPLFNQTNLLTPPMVDKAFGNRLRVFDTYRRRYDPEDRLLNAYFKDLLAQEQVIPTPLP